MYCYQLAVVYSMVAFKFGLGSPLIVRPGNVSTVRVTSADTLNSTIPDYAPAIEPSGQGGGSNSTIGGVLPVNIVNRLGSDNVTIYVSGIDANNLLIMLDKDGSYYYPTPATNSTAPTPLGSNIAIPLGAVNTTLSLTLPGFIANARIWAAEGGIDFFVISTPTGPGLVEPSVVNFEDPNAATNFAFVEFDWSANTGLYADVTFVDFVGLPLGISILDSASNVATTSGIPANGAVLLCDALKAQTLKDGQPWADLCMYSEAGDLIRVVSPTSYISANSSAFQDYFSKYGSYCWSRYTNSPLTIDTQSRAGLVNCTVSGNNTLKCDGDNRGYPLPSAQDVFSCHTGAFAVKATDNAIHRSVVPRLCAAFNRATLYLPNGNIQPGVPPSQYYSIYPANWYAALLHGIEVGGHGYAFAYDDVSPSVDENISGLIASSNPVSMMVIVGGA